MHDNDNAASPLFRKMPQAIIATVSSFAFLLALMAVAFQNQTGHVPNAFFAAKLLPFAAGCSVLAGLACLLFSRLKWYAAAGLGVVLCAFLFQVYFLVFGAGL